MYSSITTRHVHAYCRLLKVPWPKKKELIYWTLGIAPNAFGWCVGVLCGHGTICLGLTGINNTQGHFYIFKCSYACCSSSWWLVLEQRGAPFFAHESISLLWIARACILLVLLELRHGHHVRIMELVAENFACKCRLKRLDSLSLSDRPLSDALPLRQPYLDCVQDFVETTAVVLAASCMCGIRWR